MKLLMRLLIISLGIAAALCLYACVDSGAAEKRASLGEEFSLALGGKIEIDSENLSLHFISVPDDFRCPTQVDCESEGQAIVVVEALKGDEESALLKFNTSPWPDTNIQIINELGYVFELIRLAPYPEHPKNPIQSEDYRAFMVVQSE